MSMLNKTSIIIVLLVFIIVASSSAFNPLQPWHPIQQTTTDNIGTASVDANGDGIIDSAESLKLNGGIATIGNGTGAAKLAINGSAATWSAIDFLSAGANLWGIGRAGNDFYINEGAANRLTITPGGNVGIGTPIPAETLHVIGWIMSETAGSNPSFHLKDSISGQVYTLQIDSANSNFQLFDNKAGQSRLVLKSNGNTGIGITNPGEKLVVAGNINASGKICDINGCIGPGGGSGTVTSLSQGIGINLIPNPITTTGTISADTVVLQRRVAGNCNGQVLVSINPDGTVICEADDTGDNLGNHIATQNIKLNGNWLSGDGGNEGVYVNNSGNVGIGTNAPSYKLEVVGTIKGTAVLNPTYAP